MSSILSRTFERSNFRRRRRMSARVASLFKKKKKKGKFSWWSSQAQDGAKGDRVSRFRRWCVQVGLELHPHVSIQSEEVCDGMGVVAQEHISRGECVAVIPRTALLTCTNSDIRDLVMSDHKMVKNCTSSWVPLLLAMAAEYSYKESSRWYPYLSLVPTKDPALPMLWVESAREHLLEGTGISAWVTSDLERLNQDYETLVKPFAKKYPELFKVSLASCDTYKKMVAFVMSYSFTDEAADLFGGTMMVPFVDLLNHSSQHHVELTFHPTCLKLMAVRDISKGEEVMNTYGQLSNAALLHLYGFTERGNPNDEALISCDTIKKVHLQLHSGSGLWDSLLAQGQLAEEYSVSSNGEPDKELLVLTHLLCARDKPHSHSLQALSAQEKAFLRDAVRHQLQCYPEQLTASSPPCYFPRQKTVPRETHSYQVMGEEVEKPGAEMVEQTVFLMRHGARHDAVVPSWKSTASRPYDTPLSKHGHYHTPKLINQRLTGKGIEVVISSPFLRCLQTATHAYTVLGLPGLHTCNLLCEMLTPGGDMQETPRVPCLQDCPDTVFLSVDAQPVPAYPEDRRTCYQRYRQALDQLADQFWPQTLLLVTHQFCVQESVHWGGKEEDVEAEYCAHVQLSRTSRDTHDWVWRGNTGIYTYDSVIS